MPRFLPKSVVCYREGYTKPRVTADLVAGVTVGIIALPLAMAFGIASIPESVAAKEGISPPAVGMYTAVVAGLIVALFGGSRVQVAGRQAHSSSLFTISHRSTGFPGSRRRR